MNFVNSFFYFLFEKAINRRFLRKAPLEIRLAVKQKADLALLTVAFNNPQVIEWQLELCKRFVNDNYLHIILDNSSTLLARKHIRTICSRHGVSYVSLPSNPWTGKHNSRSHGISLDWAFRHVLPRFSYRVLGLLDHDVFPVEEHSLLADIGNSFYMGLLQERPGLWYLWPGFFFVRSEAFILKKFSMLPTRRADTGGSLWKKVFCRMDKGKIRFVEEQKIRLRDGNSRQSAFYYRMGHWIHTVNASYWSACTPKEDCILGVLIQETGCNDLYNKNIAVEQTCE